jgi:hypothetical protein
MQQHLFTMQQQLYTMMQQLVHLLCFEVVPALLQLADDKHGKRLTHTVHFTAV